MRRILSLTICSAVSLIASAQAPAIQWEQSYGGSGVDQAYNIQQTKDGGYITLLARAFSSCL